MTIGKYYDGIEVNTEARDESKSVSLFQEMRSKGWPRYFIVQMNSIMYSSGIVIENDTGKDIMLLTYGIETCVPFLIRSGESVGYRKDAAGKNTSWFNHDGQYHSYPVNMSPFLFIV